MALEQQIEELRAELSAYMDGVERAQIEAELAAIKRRLDAHEAAFEEHCG